MKVVHRGVVEPARAVVCGAEGRIPGFWNSGFPGKGGVGMDGVHLVVRMPRSGAVNESGNLVS